MRPVLDIRGSGRAFFVLHDGARVGGPYSNHGNAVAALAGIEQRLFPGVAKFRSCCRCHRGFLSGSAREVVCPPCRRTVDARRAQKARR